MECVDCDREALKRVEDLRPVLERAVEVSGATPIRYAFHQFDPWGASGIVLIAESHISFHTWPEEGYLGMDVFTCGREMDPEAAIEAVSSAVRASETRVRCVERGF